MGSAAVEGDNTFIFAPGVLVEEGHTYTFSVWISSAGEAGIEFGVFQEQPGYFATVRCNTVGPQFLCADNNLGLEGEGATFSLSIVIPAEFGDAPLAYGTPSHADAPGPLLGASIDYELGHSLPDDGTGDNVTVDNDEDGVTPAASFVAGATTLVNIDVPTGGRLSVWFDMDGADGFEIDEQVLNDELVPSGSSD